MIKIRQDINYDKHVLNVASRREKWLQSQLTSMIGSLKGNDSGIKQKIVALQAQLLES